MPTYSPEMLRWGKIYRRKKHPQPSAPNFLYKEALSEPYNSAKFPEKPSGARAFRPDGVKNVPTRIVSNPSRDGQTVRKDMKSRRLQWRQWDLNIPDQCCTQGKEDMV